MNLCCCFSVCSVKLHTLHSALVCRVDPIRPDPTRPSLPSPLTDEPWETVGSLTHAHVLVSATCFKTLPCVRFLRIESINAPENVHVFVDLFCLTSRRANQVGRKETDDIIETPRIKTWHIVTRFRLLSTSSQEFTGRPLEIASTSSASFPLQWTSFSAGASLSP